MPDIRRQTLSLGNGQGSSLHPDGVKSVARTSHKEVPILSFHPRPQPSLPCANTLCTLYRSFLLRIMFNALTAIFAVAAVLPCRISPLGARGHG